MRCAEQRTGSIDVVGTMAVADALRGLISPYMYHATVSSGGMNKSCHCGYRRCWCCSQGSSHQQPQISQLLLYVASTGQHVIATRSTLEPTTEHDMLLHIPCYF